MVNGLMNLLKIRRGEGRKIFWFFLLGAVLQAGVTGAVSAGDSLFLVHVGAENLPHIYILSLFVMLVYMAFYSAASNRWGYDATFELSSLGMGATGVGLFFLVTALPTLPESLGAPVYYLANLLALASSIAVYTMFWNFVDGFFDIQDGKRLFAFFSGGVALGAVVGGGAVTLATTFFSAESLFLLWAAASFLTFPVVRAIRTRFRQVVAEEEDDEEESVVAQVLGVWKYLFTSRYAFFLFVAIVLSLVLATVMEFQYYNIFSQGRSAEELAFLFGVLFAAINAFNFVFNFLIFNRLVLRYGVRNVALLQPFLFVAGFGYLAWEFGFPAALFGYFVVEGMMNSVENNNQNFLYNALDPETKYRLRAFIEGIGESLATAVAGVFLLAAGTAMAPEDVANIGIGMAAVYLLAALFVRNGYPDSMIANLKKEWLDFSLNPWRSRERLAAEERSQLEEWSGRNDSSGVLALELLWTDDPIAGFARCLELLERREYDPGVKTFFLKALESESPDIFRMLAQWMKDHVDSLEPGLLEELGRRGLVKTGYLAPFLESPDPDRKAAAAVALWGSWRPEEVLKSVPVIESFITGKDSDTVRSIRVIGNTGKEGNAVFLAPYLDREEPQVWKTALDAMLRLAGPHSRKLILPVIRSMEKGGRKERLTALEILANIGDSSCVEPLLALGDRFTPYESRKSMELCMRLGLRTVPILVNILENERNHYHARSIAARALAKLAFPQMEALQKGLIAKEIQRAYYYLYCQWRVAEEAGEHSSLKVLAAFYGDFRSKIIQFILELLTLGGRLPDYEMLHSALSSNNPKSRGNAIEVVEQGTDRDVFRLLLPLVDRRPEKEAIRFFQETGFSAGALLDINGPDGPPELEKIVRDGFLHGNPLEVCLAAEAMPELELADWKERFREKLTFTGNRMVKESLYSIFREGHGYSWGRLLSLCLRGELFSRINLFELFHMLRDARPVELADGEPLEKLAEPNGLWLLLEGAVESGGNLLEPGSLLGEEALFAPGVPAPVGVSRGAVVLAVSGGAVENTVHTFADAAIILLLKRQGRSGDENA